MAPPTTNDERAEGAGGSPRSPRARRPGFSLIELLVVISVIGLLLSIALPALAKARRSGAQAREGATLKQLCVGFTVYAQDGKGALLPGYTREEWVTAGVTQGEIPVFYGEGSAQSRLYGSAARRYTWRLAPYLGYALDAVVLDKRLRAEFAALPDRPATRDGFQWAVATSPSFGMNTTWVGGDARRGGFFQPSLARWGKFYVTRMDEPGQPDRLLIFATSRGYHPIDGTTVVPGRHRIEGPWRASRETGQVPTFSPWEAPPGPFDPGKTPTTYGHLDFRYSARALVTTFDGHVAALPLDELRDMRRWSHRATTADWQPR